MSSTSYQRPVRIRFELEGQAAHMARALYRHVASLDIEKKPLPIGEIAKRLFIKWLHDNTIVSETETNEQHSQALEVEADIAADTPEIEATSTSDTLLEPTEEGENRS